MAKIYNCKSKSKFKIQKPGKKKQIIKLIKQGDLDIIDFIEIIEILEAIKIKGK